MYQELAGSTREGYFINLDFRGVFDPLREQGTRSEDMSHIKHLLK